MKRRKYKIDDYIFACASMACREKFLLTNEKVERMLAAKTADEAMMVLRELDYGDGADERVDAAGFEALLSRELEKTYRLVISMTPDPDFFDVLLFPNDYHNVKVLLKAEFLGIPADDLLIDAGSIPADELKTMVEGRDFGSMREIMAEGVEEVLEAFGRTGDPQAVDLILDKACYKDMSNLIASLDRGFIKDYLALKIDSVNLTSFIRVREMKGTRDYFKKIFIEDGNIPLIEFINSYEDTAELFAEKMALYDIPPTVLEGVKLVSETGRFTVLEKICDDMLLSFIESAKYIPCGIEPLIAYLVAKESEIKTVRIILAGKLAGIRTLEIRERARKTYV